MTNAIWDDLQPIAEDIAVVARKVFLPIRRRGKRVTVIDAMDCRSTQWAAVLDCIIKHGTKLPIGIYPSWSGRGNKPRCAHCVTGIERMIARELRKQQFRIETEREDEAPWFFAKCYPAADVLSFLDTLLRNPKGLECPEGHPYKEGDYVITLELTFSDTLLDVDYYMNSRA